MASQDWLDKDFYKVLGVSKDVSEAELKKVYRKLARKYHPDSNPDNKVAEAKFKEISEAHTVLADPKQRKEYDAIRAMGGGARFTAPGSSGGASGGGFEDVFGGIFRGQSRGGQPNYDDLLADLMGGYGRTGAGSAATSFSGPTKGRDVAATTTLDFLTATRGEKITLQTAEGLTITVGIPAGVADGQKIRVAGKGRESMDGGARGDLVLTVTVRKHPVFERDGLNLRVQVPVTFIEAVLGANILVPTLGGEPVKLKVPVGTPSGRTLRVKGRGVVTKTATGDLLATVQVAVPNHLSKAAIEKLEEFSSIMPNENPRDDLIARAKG